MTVTCCCASEKVQPSILNGGPYLVHNGAFASPKDISDLGIVGCNLCLSIPQYGLGEV